MNLQSLQDASGLLALFADPTRMRLLALLESEELSVSELTRVTRLPQSRVSTHLGKLREAGFVRDRRRGASTFYTMPEPARAQPLWSTLRAGLDDATLQDDMARRADVLRARADGETWVDGVAGQMERHYSPGRTWEATGRGLLSLLRLGDVLDVGSGDGAIAHLLARRARSITCLDRSSKVIAAARDRLGDAPNVRFAEGDMHELPLGSKVFDQVLLFNVLTYADRPQRVIAEAARVLRPGGDLVIVTLHRHQHLDLAGAYDHVNSGFTANQLTSMLAEAGLVVDSCGVTSRERKKPYFEVVSAIASKPQTDTPCGERETRP